MIPERRLRWVAGCVGAGFVVGLILTPNLWLSSRLYPLIPVSERLPAIPAPVDALVYAALILSAATVAILPRYRAATLACATLYFLYSLWDQQRWIPFFNEIGALLLVLCFYDWKNPGRNKAEDVLNTCGLIVALIYLWSGLQKLNPEFFEQVFPWMIQPFRDVAPGIIGAAAPYLALATPAVELGLALMLLTRALRPLGIVLAIAMHVFILLSVGPLGHDGNVQVWFWNIASIALVLLIFTKNEWTFAELFTRPKIAIHIPVLVYFGLLPALNFVELPVLGRWDDYQAATLYSGNHAEGEIFLSDRDYADSPETIREMVYENEAGENFFLIRDWAYRELKVPDYHALRVHRKAARTYCAMLDNSETIELRVRGKYDLRTGERPWRSYRCSDLGG